MAEWLRDTGHRLKAVLGLHSRSEPSEPELIAAAARGDTAVVEGLLREGADPDIRNGWGETALHRAGKHGHAQTAACLLAYGADHAIADSKGRLPLSPGSIKLATLHAIRQRYQRYRTLPTARDQPGSPRIEEWVCDLDRQGIVKISGWIAPDELGCLQRDFQAFLRNLEDKVARGEGVYRHYDEEEHWWPRDRAFITNNIFKYSAQLARFCCRADVLGVLQGYLGKPALISRGVAMRYLPDHDKTNDMFAWHHDMEDKRLKVMILLTDVTQNDQYMSYVIGSHQIFHPYKMFFKNHCKLSYCKKHLGKIEIFHTIGVAGDVFLFDSNGTHRGNRRPDAAVRDAIFVEYTSDPSDVWGGDIPRDLSGANPLERMMAVPKKWDQPLLRQEPAWVENLPRVETWLHTPPASTRSPAQTRRHGGESASPAGET